MSALDKITMGQHVAAGELQHRKLADRDVADALEAIKRNGAPTSSF